MLKGTLAASVTPLADGGAALDEDGFGPVVDFLVAGGLDGLLALGYERGGDPALGRRAEASGRASSSRRRPGGSRSPSTAGAQSTADTVALAAHARRDRRRCGRRDRAAVLRARRDLAARAFRRGRCRLRARALLRLRVRDHERLRDPAGRRRAPARTGAEPCGHEGLRPDPWEQLRAVPDRGARRLRRVRRADPGRVWRRVRSALSPPWPRASPRSSPLPSAARTSTPGWLRAEVDRLPAPRGAQACPRPARRADRRRRAAAAPRAQRARSATGSTPCSTASSGSLRRLRSLILAAADSPHASPLRRPLRDASGRRAASSPARRSTRSSSHFAA